MRMPWRRLPAIATLLDVLEYGDRLLATEAVVAVGRLAERVELNDADRDACVGVLLERFDAPPDDNEVPPEALLRAMMRINDARFVRAYTDSLRARHPAPVRQLAARAIGARAIAVATGRYSVEELAEHDPVAVFPNLADTDAVMRAIDAA